MVSGITFPSPVMRIDPATSVLVVERRDPDTGAIASQSPTESVLRLERETRAHAVQGAATFASPAAAAGIALVPAVVGAYAAPSGPRDPAAAPVVQAPPTVDAAGHFSIFA